MPDLISPVTNMMAPAYGAMVISLLSIGVWVAYLGRVIATMLDGSTNEGRRGLLVMPVVGLIASIGTLASAIGFAQSSGVISFEIPAESLTLIASMGRGALLMGGIIALSLYDPHRHGEHPHRG